jgi:type IV secretory pathway TrbL component
MFVLLNKNHLTTLARFILTCQAICSKHSLLTYEWVKEVLHIALV